MINAELLISINEKISKAMEILDYLNPKILFVEENGYLKGSLTDGDIRRYMMNKGSIEASVYEACNRNPKTALNKNEAKKMLGKDLIAIPVVDEKGLIEEIYCGARLARIIKNRINVPIVINAGGKGTRLEPFTKVLPKPLIPVGEYPIIEHIIRRYCDYGCSRFEIIVNYKKELIKSYFADGEKNYSINWSDETKPLGTGGGLSLLKGKLDEPFFFVSCDNLLLADYADIYNSHIENKNDITMICVKKNIAIPYGVVKLDDNKDFLSMEEKPGISFIANTAMYIVNPDILNDIEDDTKIDFPAIIKMEQEKGKKIGTYTVEEDEWLDMGVMPELEKMRIRLYGE